MTKHSKQEVDYSVGMRGKRCGNCKHYRTDGSCTLVAGAIDPKYWCKLFASKRAKEQ